MAAAYGGCRVALLAAFVLAAGALFFIIGALGPQHTWAHHHPINTCVVENSHRHVLDPSSNLVDKTECDRVGKTMDLEIEKNKQYYPLSNILFHVQIPFLQDQIMSRLFHFVVTDLAVHLNNDFAELIMEHNMNILLLEVVLGYRDSIDGKWERLAQGNITRTLYCSRGEWGYFECDHLQLFELGSVHHKQYLVNLVIPRLPLSTISHYSGIAPLSKLALYVIHQTMGFTKLWFTLKCVLFPVSLVTMCWLLWRLAGKQLPASLIEKCLVFLSVSLTTYNAPVEMLSVYVDVPWMLVVDDFRQGLLIAGLFLFWIVFVGEHSVGDRGEGEAGSQLGHYWKQLAVVAVSSIFMFIYEFCERGVQVMYPFYSLWSNWLSRTIAYVFVGVASVSALLYLLMFAVLVVRAYAHLRSRQKNLSQLSPRARERAKAVFSQWKCFLLLTTCVTVVSIATVVLPSEVLLHQWQHKKEYSIYTALVTGNYGLWNAYALVTTLLYAPTRAGREEEGGAGDPPSTEAAEKMLTKQSVE